MTTQGIALLCIHRPEYGYFAFNMAMSIKANNPNIPIQLIYEPQAIAYLTPEQLRFFDLYTQIKREDIILQDKISPAKAKLSLYKYFHFDETAYFDIDALAIKDLSGIFEDYKEVDFATIVHNRAPVTDKQFDANQWADMPVIREYYSFPEGAIMPATNTSFFFARKSEFADKFFSKALENINNPIPIHRLKKTWGNGQPDELYVNITLAQLGFIPEITPPEPVHLRNRRAHGETKSLEELKKSHYAISVYGDLNYNHHSVIQLYDRLLRAYSIQMLGQHPAMNVEQLMQHKWVRNKG